MCYLYNNYGCQIGNTKTLECKFGDAKAKLLGRELPPLTTTSTSRSWSFCVQLGAEEAVQLRSKKWIIAAVQQVFQVWTVKCWRREMKKGSVWLIAMLVAVEGMKEEEGWTVPPHVRSVCYLNQAASQCLVWEGNGDPAQACIPVSYTHLTLPTKRIV